MFNSDKVHFTEVIKWGLFDGILVGIYISVATIVLAKHQAISALSGGWEYSASILLLLLIVLSAIITVIIVFARPIFSLLRRNYRDAALTVVVTIITIVLFTLLALFAYPQII